MLIELLDHWGRQVVAELIVRRDTVELRCRDVLVGIANRDFFRAWIRSPEGNYAYDELMWFPAGDGVALAIDNVVLAWPLPNHVLNTMRELV